MRRCEPTDNETRNNTTHRFFAEGSATCCRVQFTNHVTDYDGIHAAAGCHVPIAYIGSHLGSYVGAAIPNTDLTRFRSLTPHLLTAETLGSGHFSPLFVPDQINAILSTFVELYSLQIER
jgi:hypothetical protein